MAHPAAGVEVQVTAKKAEAMRLRALGSTYREIAGELGISLAYAYELVQGCLADVRAQATESADEARQVELERLDKMTAVLNKKLARQRIEVAQADGTKEWVDNPDEATVSALLRVQERRAKLLGLDAPQEIVGAGGGPIQISNAQASEEFITRVEKLAQRLAAGESPESVATSLQAPPSGEVHPVVPVSPASPSTNGTHP